MDLYWKNTFWPTENQEPSQSKDCILWPSWAEFTITVQKDFKAICSNNRVYENCSVSSNMELYCHTGDKQSFSPSPCKYFNQKFYYSCLHMWLYTKNINFHVVLCFHGGVMFLMHLHLCMYACTCVFKISSLRWFHSEKGKVMLTHTVHGFHWIFCKLEEVSFLSDLNSAFFLVQIVYTSYFWLWLGTIRLSRKLIDFLCVCVLALFIIKIPDYFCIFVDSPLSRAK